MKNVCKLFLIGGLVAAGACRKEATVPTYAREKPHASMWYPLPPVRPQPDTSTLPRFPKPIRPVVPLTLSRCIDSYADLTAALGATWVQAASVVLENGVTVPLSEDLAAIVYRAIPEVTGSSLFRSQLLVEWRPDPSTFWQGFSADVWTLGCVYPGAAAGPFTNILKDGVELLINTCFFWGVPPYQGVPIRYLVVE